MIKRRGHQEVAAPFAFFEANIPVIALLLDVRPVPGTRARRAGNDRSAYDDTMLGPALW